LNRSSDSPAASVEELATALAGLGLTRLHSWDEIQEPQEAGGKPHPIFLVSAQVRFAQHFDLEVDLLVYDRVLGTLGLVYQLRNRSLKLAGEVLGRIDQATYVRHLLATHNELKDRLPLTVELVLLAQNARSHLRRIGNALRRVARDTPSFLEAVGVNLLIPQKGEVRFPLSDLRRAFPWLLQATRTWYGARSMGKPAASLAAIELLNYRLPGRRTLALQPRRVHLVFGQNGSGKSSLVEALELAVTGTAERLTGATDLAGVIRNRSASGSARVILRFRDGATFEREVGAAGVADPLDSNLRATGFRLDQQVMDRLTRLGDAQRAQVFLQSFFSAEHEEDLAYRRSVEASEKALSAVPPTIREQLVSGRREGEDPEEGVLRQLAWLEEPESRLAPAVAEACLPLPAATLEALGTLSPELAQLYLSWSQQPPTVSEAAAALGRIDEALERLRGSLPEMLETLRIARDGLQRVEGWQATGSAEASLDFLTDLNAWLRRYALCDLAERHCQLLEALAEARQAGWAPEPDTVGPFVEPAVSAADLAAQRQQAADWVSERDELFQQVMAAAPSQIGEASRPSAEVVRPSRAQKERLDVAGGWLLRSTGGTDLPLGQAIEQALKADRPVQAGNVAIGTGDWARPLLDRLARLEEAGRALRELVGGTGGGRNFEALKQARSRYANRRAAGGKVEKSFLRQLRGEPGAVGSSMIEALNELIALFTPARWAYEDITLGYREGDAGAEEVTFQIGDHVDAALSLNSAQLNLFTVALFLLCAVRADNPLGVFVLDDPLQNMDELTVTTLARGLAKVSRMWGERWQLLLFFHGQEDRERFLREVPLATYELPWLSHDEEPPEDSIGIRTGPSVHGGDIQLLTDVARPSPDKSNRRLKS
jgi:energy-coupling factor transporter ATP-binding protein EcfA2